MNPQFTPYLNPNYNSALDLGKTMRFSGLYRWTPDGEVQGYVVHTGNKAVFLLFDEDLRWVAYAVDNGRQGYNLFCPEGEWKGYLLKNAAGGLNEFTLEGEWVALIQ
jgi:hypothetical protein